MENDYLYGHVAGPGEHILILNTNIPNYQVQSAQTITYIPWQKSNFLFCTNIETLQSGKGEFLLTDLFLKYFKGILR